MADKKWYEDEELLLGGDEPAGTSAPEGNVPWYEDEQLLSSSLEESGPIGASASDDPVQQVEQEAKGSPWQTFGKQAVETAGNLGRTALAAPAALISGTDRLLSGRGNGLDTYNEEFGKYQTQLGQGISGDPGQDTDMERRFRVAGDTLGLGFESGFTGLLALPARINSATLSLVNRANQTRTAAEATTTTQQLTQAIKNAPEEVARIYDNLITNPAQFTAIEITSNFGAASGAAIAEVIAPGSTGARAGGEVIGGFASPARTIAAAAESGPIGAFQRLFRDFGDARAESKVQSRLIRAIENSGEDAGQLIADLRGFNQRVAAGDIPELTSGLATGSDALLVLENQVTSWNSAIEGQRVEKVQDAFQFFNRTLDAMVQTGNPEDIRSASILHRANYEELLDSRIRMAQQEASSAMARLDGADTQQASREVYNIIETSIRETRKVEDELWDKVPKNVFARTGPIKESIEGIAGRLTPSESFLPRELRGFETDLRMIIDQRSADGSQSRRTTTGDLINMKQRLGDRARTLRNQGDYSAADIAGQLQDGLRRALEETRTSGELGSNPAYVRAVEFSQARIDRYRETFAGRADPQRAERNRATPEMLLDEAFGASRSSNARQRGQAAQRFGELREGAATPAQDGAGFDTSILGPRVRDAQDQFIRGVVIRDFAEEVDGNLVVNYQQLNRFVNNNPQIMEEFPVLAGDLQDATTAQRIVNDMESEQKLTRQELDKMAFSRMIGDTPPETAVYDIMFSKNNANARDNLRNLLQVANQADDGGEAFRGLQSATTTALFRAAGRRDGDNFFTNLKQVLDSPINQGQPPTREVLSDLNIIDEGMLNRLDRLAGEGSTLTRNINRASTAEAPDDEGVRNAMTDFALRVQGAYIGGKVGGLTGRPGGLVEAEAGSRLSRYLFAKMPGMHAQRVLERAIVDPNYMAKLLELNTIESVDPTRFEGQLESFLIAAGIEFVDDEEFPDRPSAFEMQMEEYIPY